MRLASFTGGLRSNYDPSKRHLLPENSCPHQPEPPPHSEPSLEMSEGCLTSIPEIEQPLEAEVEFDFSHLGTSSPPFSVGGTLGRLVNVTLRSTMGIFSPVLSVLGAALDGPKSLWKNNAGALAALVFLALAVYILRQGGVTAPWIVPP